MNYIIIYKHEENLKKNRSLTQTLRVQLRLDATFSPGSAPKIQHNES